jgi:hypothetical protein
MRSFIVFSTILLLIINISCKKSSSPTGPGDQRAPVSIAEYGSSIDANYYKIWSDSTWECFGRNLTINGIFYTTIMDCYGDEFYYSAEGYAGFQLYSDSLILFDQPMSSFPDTIYFNQKYVQTVTFTYQGSKFTMVNEQTLVDTSSVSVSFGTFNCLWFTAKSTLSSGNQSQFTTLQDWIAKGPADIKEILNSGETIFMMEGVVNGTAWGVSSPKLSINKNDSPNHQIFKRTNNNSLLRILRPGLRLIL